MSQSYPDAKDVQIISVSKRGEWYHVEGITGGRKASAEIPAPAVERDCCGPREALFRRTIKGVAEMERDR